LFQELSAIYSDDFWALHNVTMSKMQSFIGLIKTNSHEKVNWQKSKTSYAE